MKKIALFLPNFKGGGAEKVSLLLANEFLHQGFAVDLVLSEAEGEFLSELNSAIQVVDLKAPRIRHVLKPLLNYLNTEKPDILLALMWPLTLQAVIAFKLAKLPGRVVVSDHTTFSQSPILKSRLKRWFFRCSLPLIYPLADARLAVSHGVAEDLSTLGRIKLRKIKVIPNPIELKTNIFSKQEACNAWGPTTGKKIVAVGALKSEKDYPCLLEAFALLLQKKEAVLSIIGEGSLKPELEQLTKKLNLTERVCFVGFSKQASAWMASADLLVLSSSCEGFGNVLVESLGVGTAVVSTDCKSGPREILCDGKYGKLVPVGDVDALAQAMFESLNEHHDVDALKLRATEFSVDKIAKQYLEVFR